LNITDLIWINLTQESGEHQVREITDRLIQFLEVEVKTPESSMEIARAAEFW